MEFILNHKKKIGFSILVLLSLIVLNPFGYNDLGYREIVESPTGANYVTFKTGYYLKFPNSKTTRYPNVISVARNGEDNVTGSTIDGAAIPIRFNDGTTADMESIIRFRLPDNEGQMLSLHGEVLSVSALSLKLLQPFSVECAKNAAQLMTAEECFSGGRAVLSQDFQDQLENGLYILDVSQETITDTITLQTKVITVNNKRLDSLLIPIRKTSDLAKFGITVTFSNIENIDYEEKIDQLIAAKIIQQNKEIEQRQGLITAQQEALTVEAQGKKTLIEKEYLLKEAQMEEVVQAQMNIQIAESNKQQNLIQLSADSLKALSKKTLADAEAYEKAKVLKADGALTQKLEAMKVMNRDWANALSNYKGNIVPLIEGGEGKVQADGFTQFMQLMNAKTAKDLQLNMKVDGGN